LGLCRDDGEDAVEGFERGADAFILSIHFILRNPVLWAGSELSGFASKKLMGYPFAELFPQLSRKDQSHEPVSKVITSALALSISHRLDAEVSFSGAGWSGRRGSPQLHPGILWSVRV
jgi:hypothetical protein